MAELTFLLKQSLLEALSNKEAPAKSQQTGNSAPELYFYGAMNKSDLTSLKQLLLEAISNKEAPAKPEQTQNSVPELHIYGAVNMIAQFMDTLGQTLTVYSEQLDLNSQKADALMRAEGESSGNEPSTYVGFVFGSSPKDYQDLQKQSLIEQNLTTQLTNNEEMISGQVSNNAAEIFGMSMTGKMFIGAYMHLAQTGLRG